MQKLAAQCLLWQRGASFSHWSLSCIRAIMEDYLTCECVTLLEKCITVISNVFFCLIVTIAIKSTLLFC